MRKTLKQQTISVLMILAVTAIISMTSCSKDADTATPVPGKELTINSGNCLDKALNDSSIVIDVASNKQFSFSVNGGSDWITPADQNKTTYKPGNHIQIKFNLQTPKLNAEKRIGHILFSTIDAKETQTVTVYQSGSIDVKTPGTLWKELRNAGVKDSLSVQKLTLLGTLNSTDIICLRAMTGGGKKAEETTKGQLSDLDISKISFKKDTTTYYTGDSVTRCSILSVDSLPLGMFIYSGQLKKIKISDKVVGIGRAAFANCTSLTDVTIPNSVTFIGNSAFCLCTSLTNISIPNSVTFIDGVAFGATGIKEFTFPKDIKVISSSIFIGCKSLIKVSLPDGVTDIGPRVFNGCYLLKELTVPAKVTSIGESAFYDCSSLHDLIIKVPDLSKITFGVTLFTGEFSSNCTLHVPAGLVDAYKKIPQFQAAFGDRIVAIQ